MLTVVSLICLGPSLPENDPPFFCSMGHFGPPILNKSEGLLLHEQKCNVIWKFQIKKTGINTNVYSVSRLAKCRQISIFAMPVALTGKYWQIMGNTGK